MTRRRLHVGPIVAVYCVLLALYMVAAWPAALWLPVQGTSLALHMGLSSRSTEVGMVLIALVPLILLVLAVVTLMRARSLAPGSRGRVSLAMAGIGGAALLVSNAAAILLLFWGAKRASLTSLSSVQVQDALYGLPTWGEVVLIVAWALDGIAWPVATAGEMASWFLVPERLRRRIWAVVDGTLLAGFVFVTVTLPMEPASDNPNAVALAVVRLTVTALFALRLAARVVPPLLHLVEGLGFRPLVAARHLRAKKSSFLAAIGVLSVLAVGSSSCSLTTTLSVMGGFRTDLKHKILGNNAHVVVDKPHATFEGWKPVLEHTRAAHGVAGASPYVSGEVMITSASNLAGAVLRGIDTRSIGQVTNLPHTLTRGKLDYLLHPKKLLDLPPEDMEDLPLETPPLHTDDAPGADKGKGHGGGAVRAVDQLLHPVGPGKKPKGAGIAAGGATAHDDLGSDDLLAGDLGNDDLLGDGPDTPRQVLPGLIVGRELARTLHVYVGDDVNVVSPLGELGPAGPMPKSRPFRVAGIFYSGMYEYDMKYAYVTLDTAQRFLNTGDAISGIEIKAHDVEKAPAVAAAVRQAIGRRDLRVRDWEDLNKNLFGALALEKLAMFVTLGIAIMVAGFCVFGTLTLMVQEKGREVGILKAMGASKRSIVSVFMIEGLLIGLLGSAIGLGLGFVVCFAAEHFGIRMNPEVYYIDKLPVHIDPVEFTLVGVASAVVCLLATIFPALMASRLRPVDALRYD